MADPTDPTDSTDSTDPGLDPPAPVPLARADEPVDAVVARLGLERHPEGGWFGRFLTHPDGGDGRPVLTAIHYLLAAGERSHWHRIDAIEVWAHAGGRPLALHVSADGEGWRTHVLGPDAAAGQEPSVAVPAHAWQSAEVADGGGPAEPPGSDGEGWSLVVCAVAPGFTFEGFELAPPCWSPGLDR